jgi:hypothetical protein
MDLKGLASPEERSEFVRERLKAGVVIQLHCPFTDPPKLKRLLILAPNRTRPLFFIINSDPPPFAKANEHILARHLPIAKASENFLDHDSYLDCSNAYDNFDKGEIEHALIGDTTLILGDLSSASVGKVLDIITNDPPSLSPIHISAISDELSKLL